MMTTDEQIRKKMSLLAITWPIFIEVFLNTFMRIADIFMLSFVSDEAVAAIGVVNQLMMFTFVLFNFTAMGTGVVVAQFVGAEKWHDVSKTIANAIFINLLFGIFISSVVVLFRYSFLDLFQLPKELLVYADQYILIVGGTLFTQSIMMTIFSVLQAQGFTKEVMYIALGMNVFNIIGNALFIFGLFGIPTLGVMGVAISTAICRGIAVIVAFILLYRKTTIPLHVRDYFILKKRYVKKILQIGIPGAGEHLSHNLSQLTITVFITMLGTQALTTRIYTQNLTNLMTVFSLSIAKGMQIYIGQLVGAGKLEEAYKEMYRGLKIATIVALIIGSLIAISGEWLLGFFTSDSDIIALGSIILFLGMILEPGRTFNLVIISSLRASGDATYPVLIGILSMWGISVTLAYLFGLPLGYGLIGITIAIIIDEWFRGGLMFWRWRSKKWQEKKLVENDTLVTSN